MCRGCAEADLLSPWHFGAHITTAKADRAPEQPRWHAFHADDAQAQAKAGHLWPVLAPLLASEMQARI